MADRWSQAEQVLDFYHGSQHLHAPQMNYRERARTGPIGSGAVESACRQRQCRFKRAGQFWSEEGLRHLCALQEARRNGHGEELWSIPNQPR